MESSISITTERRPRSIDFFFDPQCPFAYQTSRFIREVMSRTGLKVNWRFFSLQEANRESSEPHLWNVAGWNGGWSLMRIGAMLREQNPTLLDRWYACTGKTIHEYGRPAYEREVAEEVVRDMGLPEDTIDRAVNDPATGDAVRVDHEWLVTTHGGFGVPTLVFPWGKALYGPVVAPAPTGDAAMRLWNLVIETASIPTLYELKAPRSEADSAYFREVFAPTFRARESVLTG